MDPKKKAAELIKKHLTAIAEESMDSNNIMFYTAKQCALVTVDMILEIGICYPYWTQVKDEIKKYDGKEK